jgi:sugar/nucleoside kinase (ribokinase family)
MIILLDAPRLAQSVLPNAIYLANYIPNIITKLGEEGCLYVGNNSVIKYFPPEFVQANEIKSVTGAGDW